MQLIRLAWFLALDKAGNGWITFASLMLGLAGAFNVIDGIVAVSKSKFYVAGATYVAGDLNTWGWIVLIIGVSQLLVGLGIFAKNQFARWVGVLVLSLNAVAQLLMIPAYPFWSLSIFAIDFLAIYGLCAYGSRISRAV